MTNEALARRGEKTITTMEPQSQQTIAMMSGFGFWHASGHWNNMLLEYVKGYAESGFKVLLVTSVPPDVEPIPPQIEKTVSIVPVIRIPAPRVAPFLVSLRSLRRARKVYQATRADSREKVFCLPEPQPLVDLARLIKYMLDVVVTWRNEARRGTSVDLFYGIDPHAAAAASLCGRLFRRPVVARYMGNWLYFGVKELGLSRFIRRYPAYYIGTRAQADIFITTDDGTRADLALKELGRPTEKIHSWRNGVPGDVWETDRKDVTRAPTFVTASRLVAWKRVDRVVAAFARLVGVRPESQLIVIGDGPERGTLEGLAGRLRLESSVRFTGQLAHSDVLKIMGTAWAVVSAYDYTNLTNQVLEALVLGVPVITLADGSTADLLRHDYNAVLGDPLHPVQGIATGMMQVASCRQVMRRLSVNAKETARAELQTWRQRMGMEVAVVRDLLGSITS